MMLKQISLSMTDSGAIGVGDNLLFLSKADLLRFSKFTAGTVMIAGFNTAQQMISGGARITKSRPLVVITESRHISFRLNSEEGYVYYASSLKEAISLSSVLCEEYGLNGYTIVGGVTVYNDYLEMVDLGKERPNSAYIFKHELDPSKPVHPETRSIKLDFKRVLKLLEARMVDPAISSIKADIHGGTYSAQTRSKGGEIITIYDQDCIDPTCARKIGNQLRIKSDASTATIRTRSIAGWHVRRDIQSVDIWLESGESVTLRTSSKSGLNSLIFELNMTAFD